MAKVIAIVSDIHNGSTVALCPPSVKLDDGGTYVASKPQLWLWEKWNGFWEFAADLCKRYDAPMYQVFNGDLTDGYHHGTTQIISANPTAQADVVNGTLAVPLSYKPEAMFFVRGTEAHVGKSAAYEERAADGLLKDGWPVQKDVDADTSSWWHLRMEEEGIRLDFAHHGRMGQRPWTKPNVTANLAFEIWAEHAMRDEPAPHIAVRSHLHRHVDTHRLHRVRLIQTPAWQLATAYIHRIAPDSLADIGGICIVVDDGTYEVFDYLPQYSRGSVWKTK